MNREQNHFVAIDFETANMSSTSACSIGVAVVEDGRIIDNKYYLIKPPTSFFRPDFIDIHGITWDDVKYSDTFDVVWQSLAPVIEGQTLFAHNAGFDMKVLGSLFEHYKIKYKPIKYFDTLQLARKVWKHLPRHKLNLLAEHIGVTFQHHNALEDAVVCAKILFAMASEQGRTIGEFLYQTQVKVKKL